MSKCESKNCFTHQARRKVTEIVYLTVDHRMCIQLAVCWWIFHRLSSQSCWLFIKQLIDQCCAKCEDVIIDPEKIQFAKEKAEGERWRSQFTFYWYVFGVILELLSFGIVFTSEIYASISNRHEIELRTHIWVLVNLEKLFISRSGH